MFDHPIAKFENLKVKFETQDGPIQAVKGVSFEIAAGETVAIVGESGSGKSVSSLSLLRLVEYGGGEISGGRLMFDRGATGQVDLRKMTPKEMRSIRGCEIGMIFQEPMTSLNPVFTVRRQLTEGLRLHMGMSKAQANARAIELLRQVRIPEPERRLSQYPHELSGGQRQRIAIARALALNPKLLIADEAVSALDVSVQAQVLNLLLELQAELGISMLFISHDMAVVERVSHHIAVMYLGRIVEIGTRQEVFEDPRHDYTKTLMAAVPVADPRQRTLRADFESKPIPSPIHPLDYDPGPTNYIHLGGEHYILNS